MLDKTSNYFPENNYQNLYQNCADQKAKEPLKLWWNSHNSFKFGPAHTDLNRNLNPVPSCLWFALLAELGSLLMFSMCAPSELNSWGKLTKNITFCYYSACNSAKMHEFLFKRKMKGRE